MDRLPDFSLDDYRALLRSYLDAGFSVRPVRTMPEPVTGKTLYLRHDVDFHLVRQDWMAQVEAEEGVTSTFFVLVSGYYNPRLKENREVIRRIVAMGHEVGLHYDLRDYPEDIERAREHLRFEVEILEDITGRAVESICMHEPSAGHGDFFKEGSGFIHPHDPRWGVGLEYVSDSCRAWRDRRILDLIAAEGDARVLLNLHGELWVAPEVGDRLEYLETVSSPLAAQFADSYFLGYMTSIWQTHEAVRLDSERRDRERG